MAVAIALVTKHRDFSSRKKKLQIEGTLSGSYVNGTPIVIDLTTVTNPKLLSGGKPSSNPSRGTLLSLPGGYTGKLVAGTTMKTWGLTLYSAPGTELASATLPAALTSGVATFEFEGVKGNF